MDTGRPYLCSKRRTIVPTKVILASRTIVEEIERDVFVYRGWVIILF